MTLTHQQAPDQPVNVFTVQPQLKRGCRFFTDSLLA